MAQGNALARVKAYINHEMHEQNEEPITRIIFERLKIAVRFSCDLSSVSCCFVVRRRLYPNITNPLSDSDVHFRRRSHHPQILNNLVHRLPPRTSPVLHQYIRRRNAVIDDVLLQYVQVPDLVRRDSTKTL